MVLIKLVKIDEIKKCSNDCILWIYMVVPAMLVPPILRTKTYVRSGPASHLHVLLANTNMNCCRSAPTVLYRITNTVMIWFDGITVLCVGHAKTLVLGWSRCAWMVDRLSTSTGTSTSTSTSTSRHDDYISICNCTQYAIAHNIS